MKSFCIYVGTFVGALMLLCVVILLVNHQARLTFKGIWGGFQIDDRLEQFSQDVESRLRPHFDQANVPYPPFEVAYLAFKVERRLEVFARTTADAKWIHICDYPIRGLSGQLGPKLAEGDRQVPEGIYRAEFLNPNSRFHVSIRLNYPNEFDRQQAQVDGRTNLGSDIMIHGGSASIGCLAVGNEAAEDLFTLAALVTKERVHILICPTDFREHPANQGEHQRNWMTQLYAQLQAELKKFR